MNLSDTLIGEVIQPRASTDPMCLSAACVCGRGKIRSNNEDNFYFDGQCLPEQHIGLEEAILMHRVLRSGEYMAVFDGMGGGDYGEAASYIAASLLKQEAELTLPADDAADETLKQLCRRMNQAVFDQREVRMCGQMGSTAAIVYFTEYTAWVCNIGDSRIFRLRYGTLEQVSRDHTDEQLMLELGITGRKPYLTQFLGMDPEEHYIVPAITALEMERGDVFLICSDGLTDMVPRPDMERIMCQNKNASDCAQALLEAALRGGGRDNITVIVCNLE